MFAPRVKNISVTIPALAHRRHLFYLRRLEQGLSYPMKIPFNFLTLSPCQIERKETPVDSSFIFVLSAIQTSWCLFERHVVGPGQNTGQNGCSVTTMTWIRCAHAFLPLTTSTCALSTFRFWKILTPQLVRNWELCLSSGSQARNVKPRFLWFHIVAYESGLSHSS